MTASTIEAFGRTTAEYMALGKPVIATREGGSAELVDPGVTGALFDADDAAGLAAALAGYASDPATARRHGAAAPDRLAAVTGSGHDNAAAIARLTALVGTEGYRLPPGGPLLVRVARCVLVPRRDERPCCRWPAGLPPPEPLRRRRSTAVPTGRRGAQGDRPMSEHRRPVTIVVPVYDDLPGLERCIEALLDTVDFERDRVLLANDVGPNVDAVERRLLELVGEHPGFEYVRNEANLGFVGNCNRAVLELDQTGNDVLLLNSDTVPMPGFLDEMTAVLGSDDTIGVVCARSDNATIASYPFARRNPRSTIAPRRTRELHGRTKYLLPRFTVAPVAMGFCFLIRREMVDRFGLFDDVFSPRLRRGERLLPPHQRARLHRGARQPGTRPARRVDELQRRPRTVAPTRTRADPARAVPVLRRRPRTVPGPVP
ncbi:glycosyltransferase [Curtobacterium sp. MCPF17_052]|uniref:glycosyltransferase n=1 Tax=Curtobacterium sp. MCPF17_052 TaxID=2175655 RepID=UPI0024DF584D|nr:glycosyltransferase [Curtobacterium sp. MCPF17_052]WIB12403.1 glycosyltransferase [Curtobacterium sp. MCPF17_052]